eukprot:15877989-Heterocapsa_arctica.AAC.1
MDFRAPSFLALHRLRTSPSPHTCGPSHPVRTPPSSTPSCTARAHLLQALYTHAALQHHSCGI